ncbi:MAG: hypothetical protein MJA83_20380, partial [Gammaproteobacteria bacterium]|nr:hypothetical protein [Gammaproteobacteria bacterium]
LAKDLARFNDAFDEFHDCCYFLCDAFSALALEEESLDPNTATGLRYFSHWMKDRAGALKQDLKRIQKKAGSKE